MIVTDLNNNYKVILNKTDVNHYYWMNDNIVVYARVDKFLGLYIINVTSLVI